MTQAINDNPAQKGDLTGLAVDLIDHIKKNTDGMLPVKVVSHDRSKRRVVVEHLINILLEDGTTISRGEQEDVQTLVIGGGGFVVDFYLPKNTLGWLVASDRDLSTFKSSYQTATPNTERKKEFSDSLFIPDVMTGYQVADGDEQRMVIQSMDAQTKITLGTDGIIHMQGTTLQCDFTDITMNASNNINLNATNEIQLVATGDITATSFQDITLFAIDKFTANANHIDKFSALETTIQATTINVQGDISGTLTNDGVAFGKQHVHSQGTDSHGDTQQNTSTPI